MNNLRPQPWRFAGLCLLALSLAAPFAAGGQQAAQLPPLPAGDLPEVVARVDGDPITKRELLGQAQTMRLQAVQAGASDPGQSEQFLSLVLDALISERLVYADSQSRGIGPSEAEVDERVRAVVAAYGGEEGFAKALEAQGLDREYVRRQVSQTLSFDHVMNREIKPGIEIGEQAVADYYERYKERMKVPAQYKLRHVMKQVPEDAGAEARQAARAELEALRQQVEGGADLAALAREHSDDPKTREQGGAMPWIVLTGRGGELDELIAGLEVGELSEVVETDAGWHLIRLEDKQPERIKTLEEARGEIAEVLMAREARQLIQSRVERLRSGAKVEILM